MDLGRHLHELFRLRRSIAVCLLLASLAAAAMAYKVTGVLPPAVEPRSVEMASATTDLLVDTPLSSVLDLRQGSSEFETMTSRAVLIGNVMASPPVLRYIGRNAGISPFIIRAQAPLTPDFPRPLSGVGHDPKTGDLLKSTEQYRLNIQANPTVPILQIHALAPSAEAAATLANAAVDGLGEYLQDTAEAQGTPPDEVVRLQQLGRAKGVVINGGIRPQLTVLTFLIVFGIAAVSSVFIARVRRGWHEADAAAEPEDELDDPGVGAAQGRSTVPVRSA